MARHTQITERGPEVSALGPLTYENIYTSDTPNPVWDFDYRDQKNGKIELAGSIRLRIINMPDGAIANLLVRMSPDGNDTFAIVENQGGSDLIDTLGFSGRLINPVANALTHLQLLKYGSSYIVRTSYIPDYAADVELLSKTVVSSNNGLLPESAQNTPIFAVIRADGTWGGAGLLEDDLKAYLLDRAHHTGTQSASTIYNFNTAVQQNKLNQLAPPDGIVSMAGFRIINLGDPIELADAVNKKYLEDYVNGIIANLGKRLSDWLPANKEVDAGLQRIINVHDPVEPQDAVTKKFLEDYMVNNLGLGNFIFTMMGTIGVEVGGDLVSILSHGDLIPREGIHKIFSYEFDDKLSMLNPGDYRQEDIRKIALLNEEGELTFWMLMTVTGDYPQETIPTWIRISITGRLAGEDLTTGIFPPNVIVNVINLGDTCCNQTIDTDIPYGYPAAYTIVNARILQDAKFSVIAHEPGELIFLNIQGAIDGLKFSFPSDPPAGPNPGPTYRILGGAPKSNIDIPLDDFVTFTMYWDGLDFYIRPGYNLHFSPLSGSGPIISSIDPDTIQQNSPATNITINGIQFNGATVKVDGVSLTIVSQIPTQIIASIPGPILAIAGNKSLKVTNTDGQYDEIYDPITFFVSDLPSPILSGPTDNTTNFIGTLSWTMSSPPPGVQYDVEVSRNIGFTSIEPSSPVSLNVTHWQINNLEASVQFFWRVRAKTNTRRSAWSLVRKFTTDSIVVPDLVLPANGTVDFVGQLEWSYPVAIGNTTFDWEVNTSPTFDGNALVTPVGTNALSWQILDYDPATVYYWWVRAITDWGYSAWSPTFYFTTGSQYTVSPTVLNFGNRNLYDSQLTPFVLPLQVDFLHVTSTITVLSTNPLYTVDTITLTPDVNQEIHTTLHITYTPDLTDPTPRTETGVISFTNGLTILRTVPASCTLTITPLNYWGDQSNNSLSTVGNVLFSSVDDSDIIVRQYQNLTINPGHVVTVSNRCKGLAIYVDGDCTINGTLTMTARGAAADPSIAGEDPVFSTPLNNTSITKIGFVLNVTTALDHGYSIGDVIKIEPSSLFQGIYTITLILDSTRYRVDYTGITPDSTYTSGIGSTQKQLAKGGLVLRRFKSTSIQTHTNPSTVSLASTGSAFITSESNQSAINANGRTFIITRDAGGMGQDGSPSAGSSGGLGRIGTCFSGGTGGGGAGSGIFGENPGGNGALNGFDGGQGAPIGGGGGGGNPGGTGGVLSENGDYGTGGFLFLAVKGKLTLGAASIISSNGSDGGDAGNGGGGGASSGGNILIVYGETLENNGLVQSIGGITGVSNQPTVVPTSATGGAVTIDKIAI